MLPSEDENRKLIGDFAGGLFVLANQLVALGVESVEKAAENCSLTTSKQTQAVLLGLIVQQVRRYRSVVLLCEYGLEENGSALTRGILEGWLAWRFVVRRPLRIDGCSPSLKGQLKKLPPLPSGRKAIDFRARLYATASLLQMQRKGELFRKTKGARGVITAKMSKAYDKTVRDAVKEIGAGWAAILRGGSYSGLSVADLAERYRLQHAYRAVYGVLSFDVHALKATSVITEGAAVQLAGKMKNMVGVMELAGVTFAHFLDDVSRDLKLGSQEHIRQIAIVLKIRVHELEGYFK